MYEIELSRSAAKYYNDLDEKRARIINRCFETLSENPFYHPNIKKLHGEFEGSYRYRIGDLRIIYSVDNEKNLIFIELIVQRGKAYR
jgi:mRNA interferase RelE/StbE